MTKRDFIIIIMFTSITIVGAGVMGSAICKQARQHFQSTQITVCDTNEEKLHQLTTEIPNLIGQANLEKATSGADLIILATKPQQFSDVATIIKNTASDNVIILSIMAGISTKTISEQTGLKQVVRTMPNTPLQLGKGVTGWYATAALSSDNKKTIISFLETFGLALECKIEDEINKITAISGSGPAYFFYATECLMEAAKKLGFNDLDAKNLALHTLFGAAAMLEKNPDPQILKQNVMSKGGTTEAAIASFENSHFLEAWQTATEQAYQRALELSQQS